MNENMNNNENESMNSAEPEVNTSAMPELPSEKAPKPKKRVTVLTTVIISLVSVILTFMITFLSVTNVMLELRRAEFNEFNAKIDYYKEQIEFIKDEKNIDNMVLGHIVTGEERQRLFSLLYELDAMFQTYEFNELDYKTITDYVLIAYAAYSGDKYSEYYTEEAFEEMMSSMQGQNQGIGVNVAYDKDANAIGVINVMPNSPALKAGVQPGDKIIAIGKGDSKEYVSELGYTAAVLKMQGAKGTTAEFTVSRNGKEIEFSIVREEYVNQSVLWHKYELDQSVAVLRIMNFDGKTFEQFKTAMTEIDKAGIKKVVFDVRANPGGTLDSIVSILDYLLPKGPIIRIVNRDGKTVQQYDSGESANYTDMKFSVLANENTASAAELFTSALMDYKRATIVGTKTYGKGSMQSTFKLDGDRGVKITTYHYLPPYSESYEGIGIKPDIDVPLADSIKDKNIFLLTDKEDNQLKAAVDALNK